MSSKRIVPRVPVQVKDAQEALAQRLRQMGVDPRGPSGLAALVIDCSNSMGERDKLRQAKDGARRFVDHALHLGYWAGIIRFATSAEVVARMTADATQLHAAIESLVVGPYTNLSAGIRLAMGELGTKTPWRTMVLVTDGMPYDHDGPTIATQHAVDAARAARSAGIEIIAIGTDDADTRFLASIVSRPGWAISTPSHLLSSAIEDAARLLPGPKTHKL